MHMKNMELYNFKTIVWDYITRLKGHKPCGHAKGNVSPTTPPPSPDISKEHLPLALFILGIRLSDDGEIIKKHLDEHTQNS